MILTVLTMLRLDSIICSSICTKCANRRASTTTRCPFVRQSLPITLLCTRRFAGYDQSAREIW